MKRPTEGREEERLKWTERREEWRRSKIYIYIYIYSNQTTNKIIIFKIDVYCSGEAKIFAYSSTTAALFMVSGAKK